MWRQQTEPTLISIARMIHQEFVIFNSKLSSAMWCRRRCWKESNNESLVCEALLWSTVVCSMHPTPLPASPSFQSVQAAPHILASYCPTAQQSTRLLNLFTCQFTVSTHTLSMYRELGLEDTESNGMFALKYSHETHEHCLQNLSK